jgi:hypothetical protein
VPHGSARIEDAEFVLVVWTAIVAMAGELMGWHSERRLQFHRPECMLSSYITSEQWRESRVFRRKMQMSYGTFLKLCDSVPVQPAVEDSFKFHNITQAGQLLCTSQFKVGVAIWFMANSCM